MQGKENVGLKLDRSVELGGGPVHAEAGVTLPHHRLAAYGLACEFLHAIHAADIQDRKLREHAVGSAKSVCFNTGEGAGRVTRADKARAFAIARGELVESCAAAEIAAITGEAKRQHVVRALRIADRLVGMLTRLSRPAHFAGRPSRPR